MLTRKDIMAFKGSERGILIKDFALKRRNFVVVDNCPEQNRFCHCSSIDLE